MSNLKFWTWIDQGRLLACAYPASAGALQCLADLGTRVIVNLTDRAHDSHHLRDLGIEQLHLPVPDFTAPSLEVIDSALARIDQAEEAGEVVAVHCQGGLGRTGTVLAAWLVSRGTSADEAIAAIRRMRPGSIETEDQEAAVRAYAAART